LLGLVGLSDLDECKHDFLYFLSQTLLWNVSIVVRIVGIASLGDLSPADLRIEPVQTTGSLQITLLTRLRPLTLYSFLNSGNSVSSILLQIVKPIPLNPESRNNPENYTCCELLHFFFLFP